MQIILLERVDNLGKLGDVVNVKPGYARNFLLPFKKALRASSENIAQLEKQRAKLEALNEEKRQQAFNESESLKDVKIVMVRAASEAGALYGSVTARDIKIAAGELGHKLLASNILLANPIKQLGDYVVKVRFHAEVVVDLNVTITKTNI